ncbi:hypothetical protein BHE74_00046548 [Ensete ventricosum]|nr:hypothetical protein BHE74_00046548 [Ensete ventricosum]
MPPKCDRPELARSQQPGSDASAIRFTHSNRQLPCTLFGRPAYYYSKLSTSNQGAATGGTPLAIILMSHMPGTRNPVHACTPPRTAAAVLPALAQRVRRPFTTSTAASCRCSSSNSSSPAPVVGKRRQRSSDHDHGHDQMIWRERGGDGHLQTS